MTRTPTSRSRRLAATVAAVLLTGMGVQGLRPTPVAAQSLPPVSGAGSTWSQNALDQWRADVRREGLSVNYQGVGSTAGRNLFQTGQVDYAVSEIPYQPGESRPSRGFVYLPIVAGGTAAIYRLVGANGQPITNLRLTPRTLARIFTQEIETWDHADIKGDNPGITLPSKPIVVVGRSDGSGTSYQFSAYLNNREPGIWSAFARRNNIPAGPTSNWPSLTGASLQPGSDGVTNYVGRSDGAITYAEASYAIERRLPVAAIRNASGNYTLPTSDAVAQALTRARINPDRTQVLTDVYTAPGAAYPISSYSYMIAPTSGISADKGRVLARFVYYFACGGQRKAPDLGYSPLPTNLVRAAFEAIVTVPGAETPPRISPETCPNPYVTGSIQVPGGETPGGQTPGGQGPGGQTPGGQTPGGQTPGGQTPGGQTPGGNTPGGSTPGGTTPGGVDCTTTTTTTTTSSTSTTTTAPGETTTTTTDPCASAAPDTSLDLDGDGVADGVDTDGDGVIDQTIDGTPVAASAVGPDGSVEVNGGSAPMVPLLLAALAIIALVAVPPFLLGSGTPGRRWWHRAFDR